MRSMRFARRRRTRRGRGGRFHWRGLSSFRGEGKARHGDTEGGKRAGTKSEESCPAGWWVGMGRGGTREWRRGGGIWRSAAGPLDGGHVGVIPRVVWSRAVATGVGASEVAHNCLLLAPHAGLGASGSDRIRFARRHATW